LESIVRTYGVHFGLLLLFSACFNYLHCFFLFCRELIAGLECCPYNTDAGMQGFCVGVDQLGKEFEGSVQVS
jgi:hypothetical protein